MFKRIFKNLAIIIVLSVTLTTLIYYSLFLIYLIDL